MNEKKTLLVVDDISINIKLIKALLCKQPYEVLAASTGTEALQIAEQQQPYAVLLDIMMPDMDGFKVLAHLKENPKTKDIKVVMQSAVSDEQSQQKAMEMGACGYLCKPILAEPLIQALETLE